MNQQPLLTWDDDDNKPAIPHIPHPRPASLLGGGQ